MNLDKLLANPDQLMAKQDTGADTGFGRGKGQNIFRWDNGVSRESTEGVLGGLPQENLET